MLRRDVVGAFGGEGGNGSMRDAALRVLDGRAPDGNVASRCRPDGFGGQSDAVSGGISMGDAVAESP